MVGSGGDVITATSGTDSTNNNLANVKNWWIEGRKLPDVSGDDANVSLGADDTAGTPGQAFTINLYSFTDANSNGVHDATEALTTVGTTETDASTGAWSFTGLGPLTGGQKYFVSEAGESGWTQTFGTAGDVITPTSGTNSTTNNFANFKNFTISGTKYTDVHGDDANVSLGADDTAGTPGQAFTINLYSFTDANSNGVHDASEALTTVGTTETDASTGAWSFTGLGPLTGGQKYFVSEAGESGWTQTFGTAGDVITPTSGTNSTTNNFANFTQFTISGTKYSDGHGDDANVSLGADDTAGTPGQAF